MKISKRKKGGDEKRREKKKKKEQTRLTQSDAMGATLSAQTF